MQHMLHCSLSWTSSLHSTYSYKNSCTTSTNLQTGIARFVSDSWASCTRTIRGQRGKRYDMINFLKSGGQRSRSHKWHNAEVRFWAWHYFRPLRLSRFLSRVSIMTRGIDITKICPSVSPSVCPLRSSIRWKRLNILSNFFHRMVAQSF